MVLSTNPSYTQSTSYSAPSSTFHHDSSSVSIFTIVAGLVTFVLIAVSVGVLVWQLVSIRRKGANDVAYLQSNISTVQEESNMKISTNYANTTAAIQQAKQDLVNLISNNVNILNGSINAEASTRQAAVTTIMNRLSTDEKQILLQDRNLANLTKAYQAGSSNILGLLATVRGTLVTQEESVNNLVTRLNAMGTNIVSDSISAKTGQVNKLFADNLSSSSISNNGLLSTNSLSSQKGINVLNSDPGPLIEKSYGSAGSRYGIGQYPNSTNRVYAANDSVTSSIAMGFAKADGTFNDVLTVKNIDKSVNISGNTFITGNTSATGTMSVKGSALNVGPGLDDNTVKTWTGVNLRRRDGRYTHFDWKDDQKNYIRGDTRIDGNVVTAGNISGNQICVNNVCVTDKQLTKLNALP
jgi:hypothetical protein